MTKIEAKKLDRKYISELPDPKDQKFYTDRDGYQTFDTKMKARELKINLAKAKETSEDERCKWMDNTKKELLTKGMTKELRLKIETDMRRDPEDKSKWTYEELEKAIKYHAFEPIDPATLVKDMLELTRGESIDETNNRIVELTESLGQSTEAKSNTLTDAQRNKEINRFKSDEMKGSLKWLLLRAHLTTDIAQQVRTHEITTNEGLGLDNGKLIEFVRH